MNTVVQSTYRFGIAPGLPGMIASMTDSEVATRICETAAGIGFGLACGQGAGDKGAVLGGANFVGISVRDITLAGNPVGMNAVNPVPVDMYGQYGNMAVMSRGDMWVTCRGGGATGVHAGDALFYDQTSGFFTNSASGAAASGMVTYSGQPAAGDTLVINGTTWTWVDTITTGNQLLRGATLGDSLRNAANTLGASADTNTAVLQYSYTPFSPAGQGSAGNALVYAAETVGTAGNAIAVTTNTAGATVTAMAGGSAAATAVPGGYWKTSAIAGNLARVSLGIQRT